MSKGIQSIEIGFTLIDALAESAEPIPLKSLAQMAQMTPSKARMYLISLLRIGVIAQDPESGLYSLGPYAMKMGMAAVDRFNLMKASRDVMSAISRLTFAPAILSGWTGKGVSIIARSEARTSLPLDFRIGGAVSLSHTATGWTLLAFSEDKPLFDLLEEELLTNSQHPDNVRYTREFVQSQMEAAKKAGYAISEEIGLGSGVVLNGYSALAIPLCDAEGKVRFALTALYTRPKQAADEKDLVDRVLALVNAATPGPTHRLSQAAMT